MKSRLLIMGIILCWLLRSNAQESPAHIPHLVKNGNYTQLIVDNKPFLVLGGELGNSSASSSQYMRPVWPKLKQMNLNTVFAPVYWELMEPREGKFDFSLVDSLVKNARLNKMRLVLLWFGAWKNSMSCYVPEWVKTNTERFPRALDKNNVQQEILTPFNNNNLEADKKAFVMLMRHIRQIDEKQNTVIAVQVENEIGMLPDARTYDETANAAFHQLVPEQLLTYLQKNKNNLTPHVDSLWQANGHKTSGTWEEVFGRSLATDEIFMAWHYAKFANEIAVAGKAIYNLPMYVNAALNRPGWQPGQYPSAGPLPHVIDIWRAGATAIDLFAPDIYFTDLKHWCDLYTRSLNPLFIPEIRFDSGIDAKAFFVFGNYNCISFSPFSIESTEHPEKEPIGKAYGILKQVSHLITKNQVVENVKGFLLSKAPKDSVGDSLADTIALGNYRLTVKHDYTLGWSPDAKNDTWPLTGCVIVSVAPGELYVAGTGIVITFTSTIADKRAGFLNIDEGKFENGKWIPGRRMNGDQDHQGRHVRIPVGDYSIQRVKLYTY